MDLHISAEHVFIACGYTDMRKSIDGLSAIIAQQDKVKYISQIQFHKK